MKNNQISLITTLFNESDNIVRFLESYKKQTKYADEFIIVDGGSTDGTIKIIEKFATENTELKIRLIVDKTCSKKFVAGPIAKGRNVAIENAQYEYIAATDAGCVLDSKWFEEIVKPFEDESVDVVSGWYEALITNDFQKEYAEVAMPKLQTLDKENFLPSSRSIAFKKECWKKVGGYPTMTYTAEDTKFDMDLKQAGCKFVFTEKAIVYWECPKDFAEMWKKQINYGFGDGRLKLMKLRSIINYGLIIFPVQLLRKKLTISQMKIKYLLLLANQIGYTKGLFTK